MIKDYPSESSDGLIRRMAHAVELTLSSKNTNQKHMEYLPYPNWNFNEESGEYLPEISTDKNDEQYSLEQFYSRQSKTFVSGQSIEVVQIEAEKIYNSITELFYPYLYIITIHHGSVFKWTIKKRYEHFIALHKVLLDYVKLQLEKPGNNMINAKSSDSVFDNGNEDSVTLKPEQQQLYFPTENDRLAFINEFSIEQRCELLQNYLNQLLLHPQYREHPAVQAFLQVSPLSFVQGLGKSVREGYLSKRLYDDYRDRSILSQMCFIYNLCKFYHDRQWFVIKDSYLVSTELHSNIIGFPMLVDQDFSLDRRFGKTGTYHGIRIRNSQRSLIIKCHREYERDQWFESLLEMKTKSLFAQEHRFKSFAPIRQQQYAQWLINGQPYMEALAKAILAAREEIFISNWWLSPELMLIRPFQDDSMRLDDLLGKRAEEGIRIYVTIFKDSLFVGLDSRHTKKQLISKSPKMKNIKVIRHPDYRILHALKPPFLYSHHEKIVVIDQRLAFIGGTDLCWGRWDTDEYRLVDLGDANITELKLPGQLADRHGQEFQKEDAISNTTTEVAGNTTTENLITTPLNHETNSKQDSSDVSNVSLNSNPNGVYSETDTNITKNHYEDDNGNMVKSTEVTNMEDHSNNTEKKSLLGKNEHKHRLDEYVKKWQRIFKKNKADDDSDSSDEEENPIDNASSDGKSQTINDDKSYLFMGKDYVNLYEKNFEYLENFDEDYIDRKLSARMPWHDATVVVTGEVARDCARHFIQRWNIHKVDKYPSKKSYPYLLPKTYDDQELSDISFLRSILSNNQQPISIDAQCIRSASFWSCGIYTTDRSVENAYIHMIDNAQDFIYIENQFFITIAQDPIVKNHLADAFYRRIIRAYNNKENFRIYIVLPLLPGFSNANALQAVLHFIMKSINKGENSLYQRLKLAGVLDPEEYITFYGMRNWDILMGNLVTEIIYVHSKIMIVDDRMCICGSANINDRSLQGTRDSEISVVINDLEMIDSHLNGQVAKVGLFSSTWRKKLFRHILGIKDEETINVDDPCSKEFYQYFRQIAKNNTQIYEEVFNAVPTNQIRRSTDIEAYVQRSQLKDTDPQTAYEKCKQIQGFIVEFPVEFLIEDTILPKWNTAEGISPVALWT